MTEGLISLILSVVLLASIQVGLISGDVINTRTINGDGCSREEDSACNADAEDEKKDNTCTLYMAESSIPNAGYGIFTTKNISPYSYISSTDTGTPDAPSIAVTDVYYHNNNHDPNWAQINYYWLGLGYTTFEADETSEMVVNFGTLANYHSYLENVEHWAGDYRDDMLNRLEDPGAGAFSYYEGHSFVATKVINAGDEIFADYGDEWFDLRGEGFKDVPRRDDFIKAAKILDRFREGYYAQLQIQGQVDIAGMLKDIISIVDNRVASLLPKNRIELERLFDAYLKMEIAVVLEKQQNKNKTTPHLQARNTSAWLQKELAYRTTNRRNVTWIQENGLCIDNLESRRSTLHQAGRGAFTRRGRYISKGEVIVPAPTLQLMDKAAMNMYELRRVRDHEVETDADETVEWERVSDDIIGKQLLVNYCVGHHESPMLLCPGTSAILINHCSDRHDWGGSCIAPNAELRWASWDPNTEPWLKGTLEELAERTRNDERGLSLEVVALRDIKPDEEVFLDYGVEWENAFLKHLEAWEPPADGSGFETYVSVKKMNDEKNQAPFLFKTHQEQKDEPYPDNIITVCYKLYAPDDDDDEFGDVDATSDEDEVQFEYRDEVGDEEVQYIDYFGYRNADEIVASDIDPNAPNQIVANGEHHTDNKKSSAYGWYVPCQILERNEHVTGGKGEAYTVRVLHNPGDTMKWVRRRQAMILTHFPKDSIKFAMKSYKSDQFLPGAFRHHIGLKDDMFPERWKTKNV